MNAPAPRELVLPLGSARREWLAGAAFNQALLNEEVETWERVWRRMPQQGIYTAASPSSPVRLEMGSFIVPPSMTLLVFDFRPDIYKYTGVGAADTEPVDERALATSVGWQIQIDGRSPGNTAMELRPSRRQAGVLATQPYTQLPTTAFPQAVFEQVAANQFGGALGSGTGTLPQRTDHYGARSLPMTITVRENQVFTAYVGVFNKIAQTIAFFEWDMGGILFPKQLAELLETKTSMRDR